MKMTDRQNSGLWLLGAGTLIAAFGGPGLPIQVYGIYCMATKGTAARRVK